MHPSSMPLENEDVNESEEQKTMHVVTLSTFALKSTYHGRSSHKNEYKY